MGLFDSIKHFFQKVFEDTEKFFFHSHGFPTPQDVQKTFQETQKRYIESRPWIQAIKKIQQSNYTLPNWSKILSLYRAKEDEFKGNLNKIVQEEMKALGALESQRKHGEMGLASLIAGAIGRSETPLMGFFRNKLFGLEKEAREKYGKQKSIWQKDISSVHDALAKLSDKDFQNKIAKQMHLARLYHTLLKEKNMEALANVGLKLKPIYESYSNFFNKLKESLLNLGYSQEEVDEYLKALSPDLPYEGNLESEGGIAHPLTMAQDMKPEDKDKFIIPHLDESFKEEDKTLRQAGSSQKLDERKFIIPRVEKQEQTFQTGKQQTKPIPRAKPVPKIDVGKLAV